ncbi:MAG TPA: ATP-binding protein [Methylothermaceae bacterium]|nr:ATP-binding protein [Methylothermaceae bacterium]
MSDIEVDIIVPNQTRYLSLIGSIGEAIARELDHYRGDRDALAYQLNLVLTEAMANAIKHAHRENAGKTVRVRIHIDRDLLQIEVYDRGQGFDLESLPPPQPEAPVEHGRGLFLIRTLMDEVEYRRGDKENVLIMKKRLQ